jgi:uncharacterized protein (DUF488 family)
MIYTIGHSKHPAERFIELLRQHDIGALADVRSTPFSRFNPQFNRERLAAALRDAGCLSATPSPTAHWKRTPI